MKNGNRHYDLPNIFCADDVDLWPGDTVDVRGKSYVVDSEGELRPRV